MMHKAREARVRNFRTNLMANVGIMTLSYAVACDLHRKNELRTNRSCVSPTLTEFRRCLRDKNILMRMSVRISLTSNDKTFYRIFMKYGMRAFSKRRTSVRC